MCQTNSFRVLLWARTLSFRHSCANKVRTRWQVMTQGQKEQPSGKVVGSKTEGFGSEFSEYTHRYTYMYKILPSIHRYKKTSTGRKGTTFTNSSGKWNNRETKLHKKNDQRLILRCKRKAGHLMHEWNLFLFAVMEKVATECICSQQQCSSVNTII